MSGVSTEAPIRSSAVDFPAEVRPAGAARWADYLALTKPRILTMALAAVAVGYVLGSAGRWELAPLVHALIGIGLVAAGSSVLNQLLERDADARMERTADRPLASGRLSAAEALLFGLACGVTGTLYLAVVANPLTAALALTTLILYAGVYTPLKRSTTLCTAIGAVPGALPPVLGWTAAGGGLDAGAFALFAVLFLWQFPHFLAIGWLYRGDYERAGMKMLPVSRSTRPMAGWLAVVYALVLVPVSLLPRELGMAGDGYQWAAIVLGLGYVLFAARFFRNETPQTARGLLLASLAYLPALLFTLIWDHVQLLQ